MADRAANGGLEPFPEKRVPGMALLILIAMDAASQSVQS